MLMVGERVGVGVAVCVTALLFLIQRGGKICACLWCCEDCQTFLHIVVHWHAVGCLGQCVLFLLVTVAQGGKLVWFLVLCGGGVVCVNCIVDACDFFFVHVLVF